MPSGWGDIKDRIGSYRTTRYEAQTGISQRRGILLSQHQNLVILTQFWSHERYRRQQKTPRIQTQHNSGNLWTKVKSSDSNVLTEMVNGGGGRGKKTNPQGKKWWRKLFMFRKKEKISENVWLHSHIVLAQINMWKNVESQHHPISPVGDSLGIVLHCFSAELSL